MAVDKVATQLYRDLRSAIQKVLNEPPKYEEVTHGGVAMYAPVKPRFPVSNFDYDSTKYLHEKTIKRLEKVKNKINEYFYEEGIIVKYEVPKGKTKPMSPIETIYEQLQPNNNTDYVFIVSLP